MGKNQRGWLPALSGLGLSEIQRNVRHLSQETQIKDEGAGETHQQPKMAVRRQRQEL